MLFSNFLIRYPDFRASSKIEKNEKFCVLNVIEKGEAISKTNSSDCNKVFTLLLLSISYLIANSFDNDRTKKVNLWAKLSFFSLILLQNVWLSQRHLFRSPSFFFFTTFMRLYLSLNIYSFYLFCCHIALSAHKNVYTHTLSWSSTKENREIMRLYTEQLHNCAIFCWIALVFFEFDMNFRLRLWEISK